MVPEAIVYQAAAITTATASMGAAVEAWRTRRAVSRHDRILTGTEYRPGLITRVQQLQDRMKEDRDRNA